MNATTSDRLAVSLRTAPLLLVLMAGGLLGGLASLPLVTGGHLLFSSIATLIAVRVFGTGWGLLVTIPAGLYAAMTMHHGLIWALLAAEALFVGWGIHRSLFGRQRLLAVDLLFWLFIGMPLSALLLRFHMGLEGLALEMLVLKFGVNGILNAVAANWLLLLGRPLRQLLDRDRRSVRWRLGELLFNLVLAAIFVPGLLSTFVGARQDFQRLEAQTAQRLEEEAFDTTTRILEWREREELRLRLFLAHSPGELPPGVRGLEFVPKHQSAPAGLFAPDPGGGVGLRFAVDEARAARAVLDAEPLCSVMASASHGGALRLGLVDAAGRALCPDSPGAAGLQQRAAGGGLHHRMPEDGPLAPPVEWSRSAYGMMLPPTEQVPWTLMSEYPASGMQERVYRLYRDGFAYALLFALVGLLIAELVSRRLAQPLAQIAWEANQLPERIAARTDPQLPDCGIFELSELSRGFSAMSRRLETSFEEVRRSNQSLEDRVRARTRELEQANCELAEEVAERARAERRLRLSHEVIQNAREGIIVTDPKGLIEYVNPAFCSITGYSEAEVLGESPRLLKSGRHDAAFYQRLWQTLYREGTWEGEVHNRRRNGEVYPEWLSISAIRGEDGEVTHYIAMFIDISAEQEIKRRLDHLAYYDELTGLPNRQLLRDRLRQALAAARRHGMLVAVAAVDVDRLKMINETLGPATGDALLKAVAERLAGLLREEDTVARLSGDQFVLVLEEQMEIAPLSALLAKLVTAFREPFTLERQELFATLSIGAAVYPLDAEEPDVLVQNAETAMYRAKELGRDGYEFYTASMNSAAAERLQLETDLRRALARDELVLHYQPQLDLASGRVVGMEALVRWEHPRLGMIPPGRFIPIAEETGLIIPIGEWVLRNACRQQRTWEAAGLAPVRMAVNLSSRQFADRQLALTVQAALEETGCAADAVELELTESIFMEDAATVAATLAEFKALGVHLAVDDFGTGYSSLSYLKRFPLDVLKVDRSFVSDVTENPEDRAIVETVLAMAGSLGLSVTAEGVESAEQLAFLRERGCQLAQGYYIGRPAPAAEVEHFIRIAPERAL